ncbi:MAG: dienelactone hydrolase family protein, partial [Leptospiraceae bacterium]|nr:dienelactone hydrolase family protein [Leptospiraceae bacterium]
KALEEIHQIIDAFQKFKDVDPNRLSLVGSCLTGGFVLHASLRPEIKAPVVFHHSFGLTGSGFPEECVGSVKHTIQGHFCHTDPLCPPEKVDRLEEQLGDKLERHDYDLPHMIPHLFRFNEEGKEAYERMLRFIKEKVYE